MHSNFSRLFLPSIVGITVSIAVSKLFPENVSLT
jgi:hypothetical protein